MGQLGRCFSHLIAVKDNPIPSLANICEEKFDAITRNWGRGRGVFVVRGFECATENEAFNREASIIHALGVENLSNINRGHFSGGITTWSSAKIHNYGLYLLYVLYNKCISESLRPILFSDIVAKKKK